jgi:hypothetical protein
MKKNIINCFLLATLLFVGCKKNEARYPFDIALARVPYLNVIQDATGSASIDVLNLANFTGKFNITLLYLNDVAPSKADIVIRKNGDNSTAKLLQSGVTTFPSATYSVTSAQIASLFGAPILLGDNYDIGVDIYTQDGTKYSAFPAAGTTSLLSYSGTGQANQPGFIPTIRFSALCAYDPNIYQGNFVVVSDGWQDTNPGDVIVFTKIDATHFSFFYPSVLGPIAPGVIVTVNPLTNTPSIGATGKQLLGARFDYGVPGKYLNPTARTIAGPLNSVTPCDKAISLSIAWGYDGGEFGPYTFKLKHQ